LSLVNCVTPATPGQSCHACGYCSNNNSPWTFDYDFSTIGNVTNYQESTHEFLASPCGVISGYTQYTNSNFTNGSTCNGNTSTCYCSGDFNSTCFPIGDATSTQWTVWDQNSVVLIATNPSKCHFHSNQTYTTYTIFACDELASEISVGEIEYQETESGDPFRDLYCSSLSDTDYCTRCMIWTTPLACKSAGQTNITNVTWNAQTRSMTVYFTSQNIIPQLGSSTAVYTLVVNGQQLTISQYSFTSSPITVTLDSTFGGGGTVSVRIVVFATSTFDQGTYDSSTYNWGTPGSSSAPTTSNNTNTNTNTNNNQKSLSNRLQVCFLVSFVLLLVLIL